MTEVFRYYVGIDWGESLYQICVCDEFGCVIEEVSIEHSGEALARFADQLTKICGGERRAVAVAIETPRGAIVEMLVESGFAVFSINPKQLDRFRDRHTIAGAKDDRRDAFVLADALRTDTHLFRRLKLEEPVLIEMRELSRLRDDLVSELRRLANQLRQQLHRFYPQVLHLSSAADEPWIWALLKAAPTPADVRRLSAQRLQRILRKHRIRRFDPVQVAEVLCAPALPVAAGVTKAASTHVRLLLPRLELVHSQLHECDRGIDELLESEEAEHRGAGILLSLPGIGRSVAATMLAEASQPLEDRDYDTLRSLSGIAPVTKRSGKGHRVLMRRACNHRLRNATYHMARTHIQNDAKNRSLYDAMRARGHGHARALRGIADRLLRILVAMLRTRTLYDPRLPVEASP